MICSKLLIREKTPWQCYYLRRKLGMCISWMLFFSWTCLSTSIHFKGLKKKKISCVPEPCNSSTMSFSNVVLMVSNSPNPQILFHFLWHLLYSLVNLPLSSFNVLLQTCDINAAEFKGSFQLLSKKFQIYSYIWQ